MKQKQLPAVVNADCIIMYVKSALTAHSGARLTTITDNVVEVPELTSDFISATLTLEGKDVNLTLTSDFFKSRSFKVGSVRTSDILISEKLAMVTGLNIYKICQWLANQGEAKPMNWFSIPQPDYDRITETKQTKKHTDIVKNTLF